MASGKPGGGDGSWCYITMHVPAYTIIIQNVIQVLIFNSIHL